MNYPLFPVALLISLAATTAMAEADATGGESKAAACLTCHQPGAFAGRSADELGSRIGAIAAGKSSHPPVGKLSAEDIASIAAFYAAATPD